jgi:hypothetical protein
VTGRAAFSEEEWDLLRQAPESAGLIVVTADKGGTFRETFALAKEYAAARKKPGSSELVDQLVEDGPRGGPKSHSGEEVRSHGLQALREARALLDEKATPEEADDYRRFVVALAERVAEAHREDGEDAISTRERAAIEEIETSLTP